MIVCGDTLSDSLVGERGLDLRSKRMKQRTVVAACLAALFFVLYGCNDTTDVPQERIQAEQKFRNARGAGGGGAQPTTGASQGGPAKGGPANPATAPGR